MAPEMTVKIRETYNWWHRKLFIHAKGMHGIAVAYSIIRYKHRTINWATYP